MEKRKGHIIVMLILAVLISAFMLIAARVTSPLYPNCYGMDSAFFRFTGKEVLRHKTPYVDFWDHKGPIIFFIQAAGALLGTFNKGPNLLFILQTVSLYISFVFILKADLLINGTNSKEYCRFLLITVMALTVLLRIGQNLNLTEDWSFPFICLSLYLFIRYSCRAASDSKHPPLYAFLHGISIGVLTFIRINNCVSIIAGSSVIGICLVLKKQYKNIGLNILAGAAGFLFVAVPILLWFAGKDALSEMFYGAFLYNIKYLNDKVIVRHRAHEFLLRYLPILSGLLIFIISLVRKRKIGLTNALIAFVLLSNLIMLIRANTFLHYFSIFVPVFMLILLVCLKKNARIEWGIAAAVFVYFSVMSARQIPDMIGNMQQPQYFKSVRQWIPQNERKSVIAINVTPEIYLNTGLEPISRYSAFQSDFFTVNPEILTEFLRELETESPLWVITSCSSQRNYSEILEFLASDYAEEYREHVENDDICFYRLQSR